MSVRPPWSVFRAALEERGFHPSRRLGQNFLLDDNMARAIVRDARVAPGDAVLEVGAGCGFLSVHLLEAGVELVSVEIDGRLLEVARALLAGRGSVRFIHGDVLAGKHALNPEVERALPRERAWHLVANLPYSVSGPLLAVLAAHECAPATMTVLVQREVAERISATHDTPQWGPLSIRLQTRYRPEILRHLAPELFWPRPQVESSLVRLERRLDADADVRLARPDDRARPELPARRAALAELDALAAELFQRRRQTLGRVLARRCGSREAALTVLASAGVDPRLRAEALDLAALGRIAAALPAAEGARDGGRAG